MDIISYLLSKKYTDASINEIKKDTTKLIDRDIIKEVVIDEIEENGLGTNLDIEEFTNDELLTMWG